MSRVTGNSSWRRGWIAVGVTLATATIGLPELSLNCAVDAATACFDAFESGVTAPADSCRDGAARWAWLAVRTPWVERRAALVLEELATRWAVARYVDAAVGVLDDDAVAQAYEALEPASERVAEGSRRLRMDDLGAPVGVPHAGRLAFSVGDRKSLDAHAFSYGAHDVAKHAIAAALTEARGDRAIRLAEHYHGQPNTDLRVVVGALDCMSTEPKSHELLVEVQAGRAEKRSANFVRNYGEVRVVLEACARLRHVSAPPLPTEEGAGKLDRYEQRMALGLRRWADECEPGHLAGHPSGAMGPCRSNQRTAALLADVDTALSGQGPLRYRLELLALVTPWFDDPRRLARIARPHNAERSHLDRLPWAIDEWVWSEGAGEPFVMADAYDAAASRLAEMAVSGDPDKELVTLAAVMRMQAARGHALVGHAERAEDSLAGALVELSPMKGQAQLARSSLAWVLGDRKRALDALEPGAIRSPVDRAAVRLQRAQLLLPDAKAAQTELLAARADAAGDPVLVDRIRWWLAATGWTDANGAQPGDAEALPLIGALVGVTPEVRAAKTSAALAVWQSWTTSPPAAMRANRMRAMRARGVAARLSLAPVLMLAAKLAPPVKAERWLDAFFAIDAGRVPIAYECWLRQLAARGRGDDAAASRWLERFQYLMRLTHDSERAELWRAAGI